MLQCAQTDDTFKKHARLAATTGSAGCLIGGCTIHSLVLLPVKNSRRGSLDGTNKANVEANMAGGRVIIIDEKSMLCIIQYSLQHDLFESELKLSDMRA